MKVAKIESFKTMSSQEIADLTGKRHDNVLSDIRTMFTELELLATDFSGVRIVRGKQYDIFNLPKREALILVSGYSALLRAKIIDRWQELELQQSTRAEEEQSRLRDRKTARLECHDLTKAIEDRYTRRGIKPATYNFSNEFNMINKIVLGETAKKFKESHGLDPNAMLRDYLSAIEIKAVLDLQATSRVLCDLDFNYDQRKEKLTKLFDQKYREAMLAEIIRLES